MLFLLEYFMFLAMKFNFVFFSFLISILGCSKLNDTEKPVIKIISPNQNDTIPASSSEVSLQFTAIDNIALSSLILEINDTNGSTYFADSKKLYGKNYSYKNSFVVLKNTKLKALVMKVHVLDDAKNDCVSTTTFYLAP
jgi:hypothetical protein